MKILTSDEAINIARKCLHSKKEIDSLKVPNIQDELVHENRGICRVIKALKKYETK